MKSIWFYTSIINIFQTNVCSLRILKVKHVLLFLSFNSLKVYKGQLTKKLTIKEQNLITNVQVAWA